MLRALYTVQAQRLCSEYHATVLLYAACSMYNLGYNANLLYMDGSGSVVYVGCLLVHVRLVVVEVSMS